MYSEMDTNGDGKVDETDDPYAPYYPGHLACFCWSSYLLSMGFICQAQCTCLHASKAGGKTLIWTPGDAHTHRRRVGGLGRHVRLFPGPLQPSLWPERRGLLQ